jgi:hypothetical protein
MIVIMVMTVAMAMSDQFSRQAVRLEDLDRLMVVDAEPIQGLAQSGIIGSEQARRLRLYGKMEIADRPADEGGGRGGDIERNLQDGLRGLPDHVPELRRLPDDVPMAERRGQFETEVGAVFGRGSPKQFGQFLPVGADRDFFEGFIPGGEGGANQKHTGKKQVMFQMSRANSPLKA